MLTPRILSCLGLLALASLLPAQTPPTAYTITEALPVSMTSLPPRGIASLALSARLMSAFSS